MYYSLCPPKASGVLRETNKQTGSQKRGGMLSLRYTQNRICFSRLYEMSRSGKEEALFVHNGAGTNGYPYAKMNLTP